METRKITVVSTKTQKKSVIMSSATTLGELKADLRDADIDYTNMTFYEGTSKTELKTDDSILPHDVPYKGTTTNELVFMLTNTNKKIKSGADISRTEAYALIKAKGLQNKCVELYGKNFTMCKTADLIALVNASTTSAPAVMPTSLTLPECKDANVKDAIAVMANILVKRNIITASDRANIMDILYGNVASSDFKPSSASPYSDDEINDMFKDMGV